MQRIRKGDEVVVIAGRDKGTKGTVLSRVDDSHVIVEGVNVVKKHVRPNPHLGVAGGIVGLSAAQVSGCRSISPTSCWSTRKRARATASASRKLTARRFACSRATVPLSAPRPNEGDNVSF